MIKETIVIFSFSQLAIQISQVLKQKGYHIVIVEENTTKIKEAQLLGYEVKNISLLEDSNIYDLKMNNQLIKAFFCVSEDKNINLFVTLSVRNIYPLLKIVSVSFASQDNKTMILAGANKIINPHEIAALRIFRLLHKPHILDILDNILFSESNIEVVEITIQKDSIFDGIYIKDTSIIQENNLILLGIHDKEIQEKFIFYSKGINHKIDEGDTIVLLGKNNDLKIFTELANKKHP